jgi:hypothetical protein
VRRKRYYILQGHSFIAMMTVAVVLNLPASTPPAIVVDWFGLYQPSS